MLTTTTTTGHWPKTPASQASIIYSWRATRGGTLIVTAAAIIDGTDKADFANEFITFLLSPEGQQYFAEETFEYPLVPGTPTAGNVPEIEFDDVGSLDLDELEGGLARTRELIADAGLES